MHAFALIVADFLAFYGGLFLALSARSGGVVEGGFYGAHVASFSVLAALLIVLLYLFRFYEHDAARRASTIFSNLVRVLTLFIIGAIIFFYSTPWVGLTPKTNLAVFVVVLFALLFIVHYYLPRVFKFARPQALLLGGPRQPIAYEVTTIVPVDAAQDVILGSIRGMSNGRVLMSFSHPRTLELLPQLHTLMLAGVTFVDTDVLFEHEDGKVSLTSVDEQWLLSHLHNVHRQAFLAAKRLIDIIMAVLLLPLYIILLPFVALAIKVQDAANGQRGKVFIVQERLGLNHKPIFLYKFRTMNRDDDGVWHKGNPNVVTNVGKFLRRSRIDELPQLLNILKGDISLIGPRPDMRKLGHTLASEIAYYNIRYIVRPGLTGWAQVTQSVIPQSVEESRERLAYDLYYIKHLSLFLEIKVILKTTKLLLTKIFA